MHVNPVLGRLGLGPKDRAVILHVDDVGMCHATIPAAVELHEARTVSSFSVMVPCAWSELATRTLTAAGADVGVHWTITSEWPYYRWSPVTGAPDLRDRDGRFPATNDQIRAQASPGSVRVELAAQLDRATQWGRISHCDSHMGAIGTPEFMVAAIQVALERGVVPFVPRFDAGGWRQLGLDEAAAAQAGAHIAQLEEAGIPLVDHLRSLPLDHAEDHRGYLLALLDDLPPGVCHLYCHPAMDTSELRDLCNDWPGRVANFEALRSDGLADEIAKRGVTLVPYSSLQQLLPQ